MSKQFKGTGLVGGVAEGPALVTSDGIAFNLGVDERSGIVIEPGHPLNGQRLAGRVLVCRTGKGSSAGSFSLLQLADRGLAPVAIVHVQAEAVVTAGAVLAGIPLVHRLDGDPLAEIAPDARVRVDGNAGTISVLSEAAGT